MSQSQGILSRKSSLADKTKIKRKSTSFLVPNVEFINDEEYNSNSNSFIDNVNKNNNENCLEQEQVKLIAFKKSISTDDTASSNGSTNLSSSVNSSCSLFNRSLSNLNQITNRETKYRPNTPKLYFSYFSSKQNQILTPRASFDKSTNQKSINVKSSDDYNLLKSRLPRIPKVVKENLLTNQGDDLRLKHNTGSSSNINRQSSFFFPLLIRNNTQDDLKKNVSFATITNSNNSINGTKAATISSNNKRLDYFEDPLGVYFVQNISNLG